MEVCLATLETSEFVLDYIEDESLKYGLVSYFYVKNQKKLDLILPKIKKKLLIDSGAHSFQHGTKVDFEDYVNKYIDFIKYNTDNPKIEGFFEMDVDNVLGVDKVAEYRSKLESISDKIIPVWHNDRGIPDFINLCKTHKGRKIAITGFADNDIKDIQYNLFINTAHKYGCKIHILGMTRYELINTLNLGIEDSCDSSSWKQTAIFGGINLPTNNGGMYRLNSLEGLKTNYKKYILANYLSAKAIQEKYDKVDNSL